MVKHNILGQFPQQIVLCPLANIAPPISHGSKVAEHQTTVIVSGRPLGDSGPLFNLEYQACWQERRKEGSERFEGGIPWDGSSQDDLQRRYKS